MNARPIVCADCPVADTAVCAALGHDDRAELTRLGHHKRFQRGEVIVAAGDDNVMFATLTRGVAKLSRIDADGTERIVALVHPAGVLGQLFAPIADLTVTALAPSEACIFPRGDVERVLGERPAFAHRLLRETLGELAQARALIDTISKRQAKGRVAALLLDLARAASPACHDAVAFDLPLTRGEMAQLLGLTIETVSRTLTAFESAGLIERHGASGITLRDPARLSALLV
jgi:CRP/FNR family transcriptional regulator